MGGGVDNKFTVGNILRFINKVMWVSRWFDRLDSIGGPAYIVYNHYSTFTLIF